jgi:hypothetical protein
MLLPGDETNSARQSQARRDVSVGSIAADGQGVGVG